MLAKLLERNQHPVERFVRVAIGLGLLACFFVGPRAWWGLIGVIPLVTGFSGSCPLYGLLGISTCRPTQHTVL